MKRTPFADWPCSIARAVDILGDWWTPLVLRESYYGVRRFEDFQKTLGIGRNILTQRLNRLVDEGLLVRRPYQDKPLRNEYVLTDKGRDFFPVLMAMVHWGDKWLSEAAGPPITMHHTTCDHDMHAEVVCSQCKEPLKLADTRASLGPGYPKRHRERALATGRFTS